MREKEATRFVLDAALGTFSVGTFMLALYPTNDIRMAELFVMALSAVSVAGLVAHALPTVRLPGEEYARLVAGAAGLATVLLYLSFSQDPEYEQARLGLLLTSGVLAGYGGYLAEGRDEQQ
jgi:hypothetical protein